MVNWRRYRRVLRSAEAPLRTRAELSEPTRRAARDHCALLAGRGSVVPPQDLPPALVSYVEKVARHAHKLTEEDIDALKAAGLSEDGIFELTVCAALGAGLGRLRRAVEVLGEGVEDETAVR